MLCKAIFNSITLSSQHHHHLLNGQVCGVAIQVGLYQGEHECDRLVGHCALLHLSQVELLGG